MPTDNSLGTSWYGSGFDDSAWTQGYSGVGFDAGLPNESEPNGSTSTADNASSNFGGYSGNLYQMGIKGSLSGDDDWFNLGTMQPGDVLSLTLSGAASSRGTLADPKLELWCAGSGSAVTSDDDSGPGADSSINRFSITTADTYYARVVNKAGTGTYDLGLWLENSGTAPTTGGTFVSEQEPNNSLAAANNASGSWRGVQLQSPTSGSISPAGDIDFFQYTLTAGDLATVRVAASGALDAKVTLLNSSGTTVIAAEDGSTLVGNSNILSFVIPSTGTYYVKVEGTGGTTGNYTSTVYLSSLTGVAPSAFTQNIGTNVQSQMFNTNASAYIRMHFPVELPDEYDTLTLHIKYDDGFVAYINGTEVARRNAPTTLSYNSAATADHPDNLSVQYEDIPLALPEGLLLYGDNVLAIQGLNTSASDPTFLISATLDGIELLQTPRYFQTPTRGAANNTATAIDRVADVSFNHDRGMYEAPFTLELKTDTVVAQIRYTTDGSVPTATSGNVYSGPLIITKTSTISAMAWKAGLLFNGCGHGNLSLPGRYHQPGP